MYKLFCKKGAVLFIFPSVFSLRTNLAVTMNVGGGVNDSVGVRSMLCVVYAFNMWCVC